jgi:hypothetical protein
MKGLHCGPIPIYRNCKNELCYLFEDCCHLAALTICMLIHFFLGANWILPELYFKIDRTGYPNKSRHVYLGTYNSVDPTRIDQL